MKTILFLITFLFLQSAYSQPAWTQKADFSGAPVRQAATFSINNKGYVGTGYDASTQLNTDEFYEYDPQSNTWTQKADFPGGTSVELVGFAIGTKGYFVGSNSKLWEYDPSNNTWTEKATFPQTYIRNATAFVINNKAYVGTGMGNCSGYCKSLYEYNPSTNSWTRKADLPGVVRYGAVSFSMEGYGYLGLGTDGWMELGDMYKYNPTNDTWTAIANFPLPRYFGLGFALSDKGYVCTGLKNTTGPSVNYNDLWEYSSSSNTWTQKLDFPGAGRHYAAVFTVTNNKAYVGTGGSGSVDFWEYWNGLPASIPTGIHNKAEFDISVYPNPAQTEINVLLDKFHGEKAYIELSDLTGKIVLKVNTQTSGIQKVVLPSLTQGLYLMKIYNSEENTLLYSNVFSVIP